MKDKQHHSRAASLKRIAKALRIRGKNQKATRPEVAESLKQIAEEFDFEANMLRAML